jgi:PII-like signaling protein
MTKHLRIELIIERMAHKRACRVLEAAGMTGYTVLPAMAGYGNSKRWSRDTDLSASGDMVVIISVGDEAKVRATMEQIGDLLGAHIGIVTMTEVEVLRPGRF